MNASLFSRLRANFPSELDRPFIETANGTVYSYGYLLERTGKVANALSLTGVRPGDRVAVQVEKSVENVMLCLGCARLGAVYLPLNTAYTPSEIEYFLNDADPALFVCRLEDRQSVGVMGLKTGCQVETLDLRGIGSMSQIVDAASAEFADVNREEDDLAAILYTSGTTGRSKGAMLTQKNLASNAEVLRDYWRFTSDDVLLHALPIYHTHGLFVAINTVLMAGASMLFLSRFDKDEVMRLLPRATAMMGVPTFYTRLLDDERFTREIVQHMRVFISGSAPLLTETHQSFEERTGHAILERYGMTETGMNSSNPYDGERRAGTVGFPLPGIEARVAEAETGEVLPDGEVGVLEVRGPNVFQSYWRNPQKTQEEFREDGWFITGDLATIDERGYIHIVGRSKDLIISGGFNVYPKEVESEIDGLPGVKESAVIGVPHPDFGEGVVAVVVPQPQAALDERQIIGTLQERLAKYKLPKNVLFVDELPRNTMGKVQKAELRSTYDRLFAT